MPFFPALISALPVPAEKGGQTVKDLKSSSLGAIWEADWSFSSRQGPALFCTCPPPPDLKRHGGRSLWHLRGSTRCRGRGRLRDAVAPRLLRRRPRTQCSPARFLVSSQGGCQFTSNFEASKWKMAEVVPGEAVQITFKVGLHDSPTDEVFELSRATWLQHCGNRRKQEPGDPQWQQQGIILLLDVPWRPIIQRFLHTGVLTITSEPPPGGNRLAWENQEQEGLRDLNIRGGAKQLLDLADVEEWTRLRRALVTKLRFDQGQAVILHDDGEMAGPNRRKAQTWLGMTTPAETWAFPRLEPFLMDVEPNVELILEALTNMTPRLRSILPPRTRRVRPNEEPPDHELLAIVRPIRKLDAPDRDFGRYAIHVSLDLTGPVRTVLLERLQLHGAEGRDKRCIVQVQTQDGSLTLTNVLGYPGREQLTFARQVLLGVMAPESEFMDHRMVGFSGSGNVSSAHVPSVHLCYSQWKAGKRGNMLTLHDKVDDPRVAARMATGIPIFQNDISEDRAVIDPVPPQANRPLHQILAGTEPLRVYSLEPPARRVKRRHDEWPGVAP